MMRSLVMSSVTNELVTYDNRTSTPSSLHPTVHSIHQQRRAMCRFVGTRWACALLCVQASSASYYDPLMTTLDAREDSRPWLTFNSTWHTLGPFQTGTRGAAPSALSEPADCLRRSLMGRRPARAYRWLQEPVLRRRRRLSQRTACQSDGNMEHDPDHADGPSH